MLKVNISPENGVKKTNATKVVRGFLYVFATSLMLKQSGGCCDEFEKEFQKQFTGYKFHKAPQI